MAAIAVLHKHILQEFELHNEMIDKPNHQFQMKPEIRFQVFPQKEKQPISSEMSIEIGNMDDNSPLYIKLRMRGIFLAVAKPGEDATIDPKEFHKQAFVQLFNHARTLIAGATQMGGMNPISLPPINPDNLNVQKNN
ncbi:MAG: protein-export chaperone SecB [Clostridia bacterium]|nr:protein-export chaperone SecB [Clostridia bacterium]